MKEGIAVSAPIGKPGIALKARGYFPQTAGADIAELCLVTLTGPAMAHFLLCVIALAKQTQIRATDPCLQNSPGRSISACRCCIAAFFMGSLLCCRVAA